MSCPICLLITAPPTGAHRSTGVGLIWSACPRQRASASVRQPLTRPDRQQQTAGTARGRKSLPFLYALWTHAGAQLAACVASLLDEKRSRSADKMTVYFCKFETFPNADIHLLVVKDTQPQVLFPLELQLTSVAFPCCASVLVRGLGCGAL